MRALFLLALLGAITMAAVADAQDKKDPGNKDNYTEKVTVRQKRGDKFLKPEENIPAMRKEIKGQTVFYTKPRTDDGASPKGSEIIDESGAVWIVDTTKPGSNFHLNYVTKKPAEKKP